MAPRIAAPPAPNVEAIVAAAIEPGEWVPVALGSVFTVAGSNYYVPSYRLEGDLVRFRGRLLVAAGQTYVASATIDTIDAGHRPTSQVQMPTRWTSGQTAFQITTAGVLTCIAGLTAGQFVQMDSLTFTR